MQTMNERPTPETQKATFEILSSLQSGTEKVVYAETCAKLERERDEALAKLSKVYEWIKRNHPDGFIDSKTHLQNLEKVKDLWHERIDAAEQTAEKADELRVLAIGMREAIKEAHEMIAEHVEVLDWPALNARKLITALAKLQPFLA